MNSNDNCRKNETKIKINNPDKIKNIYHNRT